MKKSNKKGFTIVELVIVIAVIAILASVLIPTFASVVEKANESAAVQELKSAYTVALAEAIADGVIKTGGEKVYIVGADAYSEPATEPTDYDWRFTFTDENTATVDRNNGDGNTYAITDGKPVVTLAD